MITYQPSTKEDAAETMARLWNLEYPDMPRSAKECIAFYHYLEEGSHDECWIIGDAGDALGVIVITSLNAKQPRERLNVEIFSAPETNSADLETWINAVESRSREIGAEKINIWSSSINQKLIDALARCGFGSIQTVPLSALSIADAPDETTFRNQDVRYTTIQALIDEGVDWVPMLYVATSEMAQDVPNPYEITIMGIEQYRVMVSNLDVYRYDLMFVAVDGDRIVGYSRVTPSKCRADLVFTGLSGVVRSHRRRGIVTDLKMWSIQVLKAHGYTTLITDNDETNPMYQVNLKAGFKRRWDWVQYEKTLTEHR